MKLQPKNTGKETGVRNIPVISKGYSVTHLDFCEDNMFKYLLFSHSLLTAGNALLMCIVCNFYIKWRLRAGPFHVEDLR